MLKRLICGACALGLAAVAAGCGQNAETGNSNLANSNTTVTSNANGANANASVAAGAQTAADGSEIMRDTSGGVTTETRTFRDPNSRVERVVVTTRDGRRTARVYYRDKTVRELPEGDVERALTATGDALVSAGGKVVDVSKDVGGAVADKAEDIPSEADDAARATAKGAKKVGGAIKDAVTP